MKNHSARKRFFLHPKKRVSFKTLILLLIISSAAKSGAQSLIPRSKPNPYLHTLHESKGVNNLFNYYFQKSLEEKEALYKAQSLDYDTQKFKAESYSLQLPQISQINITPWNDSHCSLNHEEYLSRIENPYPTLSTSKRNQPFSHDVNKAYCLLQSTFQTQNNIKPQMISTIQTPRPNKSYENKKNALTKKDTLVIIIPGIFGEYIQQVAFGDLFGQGLSQSNTSHFTKSFNDYIRVHQLQAVDNKNEGLDSRFLMKNLRSYYEIKDNYKNLYNLVSINQWIKVASLDDHNGLPLFKVAILGLEPMSLESVGKQEELSLIYLRRLNKFMAIYQKQNGKLPDQIILIGYSRGAPIAYEMLSIMKNGALRSDEPEAALKNELSSKAKNWSNKIIATVSLGGVSLGSALADTTVLLRNKVPDQAKVLQSLMRLMSKIELITEEDLYKLQLVFESAVQRNYAVSHDTFQLFLRPNEKVLLQQVTKKVTTNIKELNDFLAVVGKLEIKKTGENIGKGILAIKDLATLYAKINDLLQSKGSSLNQVLFLKETFQEMSPEKLNLLFTELMSIGQAFYPNLSNPNLGTQENFMAKVESAIITPPSSTTDLVHKASTFLWSTSDQEALKAEAQSLINTVTDPDELKQKLQALIKKSPNSQELISKVKLLLSTMPSQEEVVLTAQSLLSTAPKPEDLLPIKNSETEKFMQKILNNYGLNQTQEIVKKSFTHSDVITLFKELNLNLKMFRHYFISIWQSASELSTLSRLQWLTQNAKYLPTNLTYYSVSAVQYNPYSSFFKNGAQLGFNISSDQAFLNKSWFDLQSVGHSPEDGFSDETFAGSTWNDSQVDWYKTILWPHMMKAMTEDVHFPLKFKVLGLLRTHHWGLALPFAFLSQTSVDPNTGIPTLNQERVNNINPFPRTELLKSIVMSIDTDRNSANSPPSPGKEKP